MLLPIVLFSTFISVNAVSDILPQHEQHVIKYLENLQYYQAVHPDAQLTTLQLVAKYGYNGELHQVTTSDGYILELHRITGRINSTSTQKPVVLVMPGLLASSAVWVISGREKSLGFILADAGYDVWLGNVRGSHYSRKHKTSSILDEVYWNFSWHEIGVRDLPTMIDHILKTTGREKLFYLGHSQGTTSFFVMSTELPEYQNKIQAMFGMAPVTYCSRMFSPFFQILAKISNSIYLITKLIGQYEFEPAGDFLKKLQVKLCKEGAITQPICSNIFFLIAGFNADQFNVTLLPIILGHVPAGASTKQIMHYAQLINSGKFRQFDHGLIRNLRVYGRLRPPSYDLSKIKVPVSLHYGSNDWLLNVRDLHQLYNELGNPIGKFRVPHDKFNHLDFMWAKDVKELLYDKMLSLMTRYK